MTTLPCIVCGKILESVYSVENNHPNDACVFLAHGIYGSKVFDPMDQTYLEINICDACLIAHKSRILHVSCIAEKKYEYTPFNP